MGFFSYLTADTKESIPSSYSVRQTFPVYVLSPHGENIYEPAYEGYGVFGGVDVFVHLLKTNFPDVVKGKSEEEIRRLYFSDYYNVNWKYPLKISREDVDYFSIDGVSKDCPYQGYFYEDVEEYADDRLYL